VDQHHLHRLVLTLEGQRLPGGEAVAVTGDHALDDAGGPAGRGAGGDAGRGEGLDAGGDELGELLQLQLTGRRVVRLDVVGYGRFRRNLSFGSAGRRDGADLVVVSVVATAGERPEQQGRRGRAG